MSNVLALQLLPAESTDSAETPTTTTSNLCSGKCVAPDTGGGSCVTLQIGQS